MRLWHEQNYSRKRLAKMFSVNFLEKKSKYILLDNDMLKIKVHTIRLLPYLNDVEVMQTVIDGTEQ